MDVFIVDDEPLARERLRRMVAQLPGYRVTGEAADGGSALARVRESRPDVVLLDIHMPDTDGLQVAAELTGLSVPPAVIFTTAYSEYALPAHDLAVSGYLLKPVSRDRLSDALARARRPSRAQLHALDGTDGRQDHIVAHTPAGRTRVAVDSVLYFWADRKYTTVYHRHGELLIDASLSSLEQRFGESFLRVHRKALVATPYVIGLRTDGGRAWLQLRYCADPVPVSRRRLAEVRQLLSNKP